MANATTALLETTVASTVRAATTVFSTTSWAWPNISSTVAPALNCSNLNASAGDDIPVECSSYSWLIAVAIIVCGTIVNNLGVNVQKLALGLRTKKPAPKIPWKVVWISGIVAIVLGSVCDFLALGFGDQILVTPLTSMTLVWNLFFAAAIQKEKISVMDGVWTGVIITGCVLTVIFASHENTAYSAKQLFAFYTTANFIVYAVLVVVVLVALAVFGKWADRVERRKGVDSKIYKKIEKLHVLSYPCASGLVGAQSISFAKTFVELFTDSFKPGATIFLAQWQTYPLLLAIATTTILQIYWLNVALSKWEASVVVPTFQSNWMVWSIVAGGVIYDEFAEFSDCSQSVCVGDDVSLAWIFFPLGVAVTIFGVVMQSRGGHGGGHGGVSLEKTKAVTEGHKASLLRETGEGDDAAYGAIIAGDNTDPRLGEWGFELPELSEDARKMLSSCKTYQDHSVMLSAGATSEAEVPFLGVEFDTDCVIALDPMDPLSKTMHVFQVMVVSGFPLNPATGEVGQLARTGLVELGDVLFSINGHTVWNPTTPSGAEEEFDTKFVQQLLQPNTRATFRRIDPPGPGEPERYVTNITRMFCFCCRRSRPIVVDAIARIADSRLFRRDRTASITNALGVSRVIAVPADGSTESSRPRRRSSVDYGGSKSLHTMGAAFGGLDTDMASSVTASVLNEVREITKPMSKLISRMFDAAERERDAAEQQNQESHGIYVSEHNMSRSLGGAGTGGGRARSFDAQESAAQRPRRPPQLLNLGNSDSDPAQEDVVRERGDAALFGDGDDDDPMSFGVV